MGRKEELEVLLKKASEAYYNLDLSSENSMTDEQYDALRDELKLLDPQSPEIVSVGAPVPSISVWEKVQHEIPMGSLNKANSFEEMRQWVNEVEANSFFATHKVDGSSMELVYQKGTLVRAVTRGDGIYGENVYDNVRQIPNIPISLGREITITVRGEVVMMKDTFESKYQNEYANPRNTAAGKVREKKNGGKDCQNLRFLAYDSIVFSGEQETKTLDRVFDQLKQLGFETPHLHKVCQDLEQVQDVFEELVKNRDSVKYEIDGMVVSVNDRSHMEILGSHSMRPVGQIAWKFKSVKSETIVKDINWNVGNSGRVTGVAVLEPVQIGGVTITNVSLHNLKYFRNLNLFRGCRVLISRRGDVIPYIERNLDDEESN